MALDTMLNKLRVREGRVLMFLESIVVYFFKTQHDGDVPHVNVDFWWQCQNIWNLDFFAMVFIHYFLFASLISLFEGISSKNTLKLLI